MARASLQLLQEERQAMHDQNQSSLTSAFQTAITAIRDGTGSSTVMNGSGGIGNIYRPELKSVSTLMRDKVFRGEPSSLRTFKKQWDSVIESWTSFKPGCEIPDDYRNVLIWNTLDYNVAETMDSKTVLVNGVEQRLKTHGTYNDVMAALKE
eukprot:1569-Heterococcus_DN1.PRE.1